MKNSQTSSRDLVFALLEASMRVGHRLDRGLSHIKGISLSEFQLLRKLGGLHESSATRVDLAAAVGMTPSGVTRALRPLEKLGYVKTTRDVRDARRSLAELTKQGVGLVKESATLVDEAILDIRAIQELAAVDRKQILRLLEELSQ